MTGIFTQLIIKRAVSVLFFWLIMAGFCSHADDNCPNGAMVKPKYCKYFIHYNNPDDNVILDIRIGDALGVRSAKETRAIGLVIAISKYPKLHSDIPAAAVDGQRLAEFLVNSQHFDEVILLPDEDASEQTIRYFLDYYLPKRGEMFNGKARLLIAYSGHGRYGDSSGASPSHAAFVLSNAADMDYPDGMYEMSQLNKSLDTLSLRYFHVLTLINACFGSGVFGEVPSGGNPDAFTKPGSYALAAGDDKTEVYSLDEKVGSVFVDRLIAGVSGGTADATYGRSYIVRVGGQRIFTSGITRTNRLFTYLTDEYLKVNESLADAGKQIRLVEPWLGVAQSDRARGGFFLSQIQL